MPQFNPFDPNIPIAWRSISNQMRPDDFGKVIIDDIEVTQTIQDLRHSVPLIKNKKTVVRLYVSLPSNFPTGELSGEMVVGDKLIYSNPIDTTNLYNKSLLEKREDNLLSLNFTLDKDVCSGQIEVQINRLVVQTSTPQYYMESQGGDSMMPPKGALNVYLIGVANEKKRSVQFDKAPPLRIRVIGISYKDGSRYLKPRTIDYKLLKSWLQRTFPVSDVDFSFVVTPANHDFQMDFASKAMIINAQISAMRHLDMSNSDIDRRTHYLALVLDENTFVKATPTSPYANKTFMRGMASSLPTKADPTSVACGPTGKPMRTYKITSTSQVKHYFGHWDEDPSYGDYYNGHELGHTLGRRHAGFPNSGLNKQFPDLGPEGKYYPYAHGQIGDEEHQFIGMDVGDQVVANGEITTLPLRSLPYRIWSDVMTYCDYEWMSDFTYKGILKRLREEDKLNRDGTGPNGAVQFHENSKFINVIFRGTKIHFLNLLSGAYIRTEAPTNKAEIWLHYTDKSGRVEIEKTTINVGLFVDAMIPYPQKPEIDIFKIELHANDAKGVLALQDTWKISQNASAVDTIIFNNVIGQSELFQLTWNSIFPSGDTLQTFYNVQLSADNGTTWFMHSIGLTAATTEIDVHPYHGKRMKVRVVASNGISETYSGPVDLPGFKYVIGLWPELGGYLFWISPDHTKGLVVETQNQIEGVMWNGAQSAIDDKSNHSIHGQKYSDWRLPTKEELASLFLEKNNIGNLSEMYWSSTTYEKDKRDAWYNGFNGIGEQPIDKHVKLYVRAVRDVSF